MAFDGMLTHSIVNELKDHLTGGKINKIYEPNKNEIILDIYNKEKFLLDICIEASKYRINLTKHTKANPKVAPNFCMVLRKYLTSSKILNITTYNLDRIVIIELENFNELNDKVIYKLVIELMGKHSNIILINNSNIIIDAIRRISSENALRTILPANPYIYPTSSKNNLLEVNINQFLDLINSKSNENLLDIIPSLFTGISKQCISYALITLGIPETNFTNEDLIKLFNYCNDILSFKNVSCANFEFNNKQDFTVCIDSSNHTSINSFIDDFYFNKETTEIFKNYRNNILKVILSLLNKYNKKLLNIQNKLDECKDMDTYKLYGELITANLYKINNNFNVSNIELENYYDNNNPINIKLDSKYSPAINAKNFFKKYNKLKNTLSIVSLQKNEILSEIEYLQSIVYSLENSSTIEDIDEIYQEISDTVLKNAKSKSNKKINKDLDIKETIIDNYKVYIGKNNRQNDYITFKLSDKNDLWFHVQNFHGSHVLLKTNGISISDDNPIIKKCAKLAALNSKASNENKVAVDYTLIKNIKKPNGAKPGFVIFNKHNTIIVNPSEI